MSASKSRKEVSMTKARMIYLIALLCLLAFYLQGFVRMFHFLGAPGSWHDGS
jgi:hypothetical protein